MEITVKTNINLPDDMIGRINQIGLVNSTQLLAKQARENSPFVSGTLKKSIGVEGDRGRTVDLNALKNYISRDADQAKVGPRKVVYAVRREFENKKNPHKKFYMKRTHESAPPVVKEEFEKAVKIVINSL